MTSNSSSIFEAIQHYQRNIERSQSQNDEQRLLHCINKLYKMPVKVEHLQETGVGKTVNSLRKFNGEIGVAAKALVTKWKAMVAAEEEKEVEPAGVNIQNRDQHNNNINGRCDGSSDEEQNGVYNGTNDQVSRRSQNDGNQSRSSSSHDKNKNKHSSKSDHGDIGVVSKDKDHSQSRGSSRHNHSNPKNGHEKEIVKDDEPKRNEKNDSSQRTKHHSSSKDRHRREKDKDIADEEEDSKKRSPSSSHHRSSASKKHDDDKHHKSKHHSSKDKSEHSREHEKSATKNKDRTSEKHHSTSVSSKDHSSKHGRKEDQRKHEKTQPSTSSSTSNVSKKTEQRDKSNSQAGADRKRRLNSDNDSANSGTSPEAKVPKISKTLKKDEKTNDGDDGIDSSTGANFADVLGMLNMPTKKSKKSLQNLSSSSANISSVKSTSTSTSKDYSGSKASTPHNGIKTSSSSTSTSASSSKRSPTIKPDLLSSTAKLEPLDPSIALELPTISNNYKPMPLNQTVMDCVFNTATSSSSKVPRTLTDAEALSHGISSKTMRTKIYSGVKTGQILQVPSLFDLCIRVLQKNIDALEYTGGVPFEVLRSVLERATPQQLLIFEEYNPYLMEDSDVLWQLHVQRNYRTQKRQEMETWREMFLRCQDDEERRLNILAESIKQSQKIIAAPVRKTQLAFVDSMVKPPRNVQRKQEQFGTRGKLAATPAARVAALSSVTPNAAKPGDVRLRVAAGVRDAAQISHAPIRNKKAPLMAKTLQLMRGRHKR